MSHATRQLAAQTMFKTRRARPPLTTNQRLDLELLMRRTVEVVGVEEIRHSEVVTNLDQLTLDRSSRSALLSSADAEVRRRMRILDSPLDLEIVDASTLGYASTYKAAANEGCSTIVSVADNTADDPLRTVIELAYQYSYHFWRTRSDPRPLDTDPRTTHLLPLCYGLGVLASDASLYDQQWSQAGWAGWSISRSGHYSAAELGYALALLARVRGEADPAWFAALRPDAKDTMHRARRYFAVHEARGGRLLFDAATIPGSDRDQNELADWLAGEDLSFALAAAYALSHFDNFPPRVVDAALRATHRNDVDLVPIAVQLLAGARQENPRLIARVEELIHARSDRVAMAAVLSADAFGLDLSRHRRRIASLLDSHAEDAFALLGVIGNQGPRMTNLEPQICRHVVKAIRHVDDALLDALLRCLQQIVDDPARSLERYIRLPEIRGDAISRLAALQIPNGLSSSCSSVGEAASLEDLGDSSGTK